MEASWLPVLVSAAVLLAIILLAAVCLDCGNKGPMASIRQASGDYMPSTDFRIIHSSHTTTTLNSIHSPSHLLSPYPTSVDAGIQRHRSFTPTETESNPSYENPGIGPESLDSDCEDPGYIVVLADGQDPPPNASRASTPSSDANHEYVNVKTPSTSTIEDTDYQNVEPLHELNTIPRYENPDIGSGVPPAVIPALLAHCDSNEDESSDDDEGNYVNQPMDIQPAQCMMGRVNDL
ncbi:uncharacterized protein LOC114440105 isoform X3 [Parambassis ranga]|uniref:Uncharacterized protein LOC114440105 isoform X3 n=1 Tax=Parambassis ranga TaxID=210632 RepID=A0A6P7IVA1_9TELE|nr:uncharacterized protein LOC114440105 isoform X3 [Parambassis ranga]